MSHPPTFLKKNLRPQFKIALDEVTYNMKPALIIFCTLRNPSLHLRNIAIAHFIAYLRHFGKANLLLD